jgi:hypothetical protein
MNKFIVLQTIFAKNFQQESKKHQMLPGGGVELFG